MPSCASQNLPQNAVEDPMQYCPKPPGNSALGYPQHQGKIVLSFATENALTFKEPN